MIPVHYGLIFSHGRWLAPRSKGCRGGAIGIRRRGRAGVWIGRREGRSSLNRMAGGGGIFASNLRAELCARSRAYAQGRAHVESYGTSPVIVFEPEGVSAGQGVEGAASARHGNFLDAAYAAICTRPEWMRRFDKVHAQGRSLPKTQRKWRELDSSMSSDALLMNVFCTPGVAESAAVRRMLGAEGEEGPEFGWKAKVPLKNGRFDRTEVDMRWGGLLVEAKLTENDFQVCKPEVAEAYRDFAEVFDRDLLPVVEIPVARKKESAEFAEEFTQEEIVVPAEMWEPTVIDVPRKTVAGFAGYQLIRNVLAAQTAGASFCVIHDARRPDLREAWFDVLRAVRSAELRTRLKVLTWQELAEVLPEELQEFLDGKYGIVAPGKVPSSVGGSVEI